MIKNIAVFLLCLLLLLTPLQAAVNIFSVDLAGYKMTSMVIAEMKHEKKYFRYHDAKLLQKYLDMPDSNASAINVFFAEYGKNKILFDTGTNAKSITAALKEINVKPEDVNIICITHMHYDHTGGLLDNNKRTFPNAAVYIPKEEADIDENKNSDIFSIYGKDVKLFPRNAEIIPGIRSVPAFGHTKGHTSYLLTGKGQSVLIWGDILHAPVEFAHPDVYLVYDAYSLQTIETRKEILKKYAGTGTYIAGAHLVSYGIGKIKREQNGYIFAPLKK